MRSADRSAGLEAGKANEICRTLLAAGVVGEPLAAGGGHLVGRRSDRSPFVGGANKKTRGTAEPETPARRDPEGIKGEVTLIEPTPTQRTVARRMAESKATAPDFQLTVEVDMSACMRLRDRLQELAAGSEDDVEPTYNDMVVKACAQALRDSPRVNAAYRDGRFELYSRVNVGVAVAADDELRRPDGLRRRPQERSARSRARRARSLRRSATGGITAPEVAGATFTISNLGMFGIEQLQRDRQPAAGGGSRGGVDREAPRQTSAAA